MPRRPYIPLFVLVVLAIVAAGSALAEPGAGAADGGVALADAGTGVAPATRNAAVDAGTGSAPSAERAPADAGAEPAAVADRAPGDAGTGSGPYISQIPMAEAHTEIITLPAKFRRQSPGLGGTLGLLRVQSADLGPKGQLRLSVFGHHFRARDFPTPDAFHTHTGGWFGASFTALDFLELGFSYQDGSNTNTALSPRLIQRVGDMSLAARLSWKWADRVHAGVGMAAHTWMPASSLDARGLAFGLAPSTFVTLNFENEKTKLPLFLHVNGGVRFDNTSRLARGATLSLAEQYAYGINEYPRLQASAALEAPLKYATAFFEYHLEWPLGVPGGVVEAPGGEQVPVGEVTPQSIALGVKIPAFRRFHFIVAGDVGLAQRAGSGVRATPPAALWAGVAVDLMVLRPQDFDDGEGAPRIRGLVKDAKTGEPVENAIVSVVGTGLPPVATEAHSGRFLTHELAGGEQTLVVEKKGYRPISRKLRLVAGRIHEVEVGLEPLRGEVEGVVIDKATREAIRGAIVTVEGMNVPPVATTARGRFQSYPLPSGEATLRIERDGYVPAVHRVQLAPGQTVETRVELEPEQTVVAAAFLVRVNGPRKKPIEARVAIRGRALYEVTTAEGVAEPVRQEVQPDLYVVEVTSPGYLAATREVQVSHGAEMSLEFDLLPQPKKKLVKVKKEKIDILQQVHFDTGKATIRAISYPLLHEVVDAIVRNDIKRVRIEGHTDNQGNDAFNLRLSQARAESVMEFLVQAGISRSRLEAVGYGETRPIAPNFTRGGRELNRRVEFIILEQ